MRPRKNAVALLVALAVVTTLLVAGVSRSAQPGLGVIHTPTDERLGVKQRIVYKGGPIGPGAFDLRPPVLNGTAGATSFPNPQDTQCASAASTPTCDVFVLKMLLPSDYWERPVRHGVMTVTTTPAEGSLADLYVTVLDEGGMVAGRSGTGTFGTKFVSVPLPERGTYRIRTTALGGNATSFTTTIEFSLTKDPEGAVPNVAPTAAIRFAPQTLVDPQAWGAEPGVNFDRSGGDRVFIDWPWVPNYGSVLNRSTDGGRTFRRLVNASCAIRQKPNCLGGMGGDSETALTKKGRIYFTDQEEVASQGAAVSDDHGNTFPVTSDSPLTTLPQSDRMYLATYGEDEAYMFFGGNLGVEMVKTIDGGRTWTHDNKLVVGGAEGHVVIDETGGPNDGVIFNLARAPLRMAVSKDKGVTFDVYPVLPDGFAHAPSSFVPGLAMDSAGNLYATFWTDDTSDIYLVTSLASDPRNRANPGSVWSPPVRVSAAPARTAVFSAVAAGSPGRIAVAFYGADDTGVADTLTDGQAWHTYTSFSTDALCWWSRTCAGAGAPSFLQARVSHRANHYGQICTGGLTCTVSGVDRSLLDFLDIGVSNDGVVGVVWADNNRATPAKALEPDVVFARLENGPNLFDGKPAPGRAADLRTALDSRGDATYPYTGDAAGANYPMADLRAVTVSSSTKALTLSVDLGAGTKDLGSLVSSLGAARVVYLTRWWYGRDAYFVAYEVTATGATRAFWGRIDPDDGFLLGRRHYAAAYTADGDASVSLSGRRLTLSVPRAAVGNPRNGELLVGVNSFVLSGLPEGATQAQTLLNTLDANPPLDYRVGR